MRSSVPGRRGEAERSRPRREGARRRGFRQAAGRAGRRKTRARFPRAQASAPVHGGVIDPIKRRVDNGVPMRRSNNRRRVLTRCPASGRVVATHAVMTVREFARSASEFSFWCSDCRSAHRAPGQDAWLEGLMVDGVSNAMSNGAGLKLSLGSVHQSPHVKRDRKPERLETPENEHAIPQQSRSAHREG